MIEIPWNFDEIGFDIMIFDKIWLKNMIWKNKIDKNWQKMMKIDWSKFWTEAVEDQQLL